MKINPSKEWCEKSSEIEGDSEIGAGVNPFHKPAGFHKPIIDSPPAHTLTKREKFLLMFKGKSTKAIE